MLIYGRKCRQEHVVSVIDAVVYVQIYPLMTTDAASVRFLLIFLIDSRFEGMYKPRDLRGFCYIHRKSTTIPGNAHTDLTNRGSI